MTNRHQILEFNQSNIQRISAKFNRENDLDLEGMHKDCHVGYCALCSIKLIFQMLLLRTISNCNEVKPGLTIFWYITAIFVEMM